HLGPFHLVIGNPPWFGRQQVDDAGIEEWLESKRNPFRPDSKSYSAEEKAQFHPLGGSAIPFMWKAPCHAVEKTDGNPGQVCLLLPSAVLLAGKTSTFQAAWFGRMTVEAVWQLADLRYFLFKGATAAGSDRAKSVVPWPRRPAVIIKYCWMPPPDCPEF